MLEVAVPLFREDEVTRTSRSAQPSPCAERLALKGRPAISCSIAWAVPASAPQRWKLADWPLAGADGAGAWAAVSGVGQSVAAGDWVSLVVLVTVVVMVVVSSAAV